MKSQWVISTGGQTYGPYSDEEVLGLIWEAKVGPFDYIRDTDSAEAWSAREWAKAFNSRSTLPSVLSKYFRRPRQQRLAIGGEKPSNRLAQVGFWLGVASIFLFDLGIVPLLGIGFSVAGLFTFDEAKHSRIWQAWWGLGVSIVYMWANAAKNGHFG